MEFREIQENELEAVGMIAHKSFDDYSKEDYFKMAHDNNYRFIVSVLENKVVGFVIFLRIDDKIEIIKIATDPIFRRRGIASGLLNFVKKFAENNGHCGAILEVNEKNLPARSLYRKIGFNEIHIRKKYYHNTDDAIIMEWNK